MAKVVSDGLSRLQNQSRIPASTWRQWCTLLKLDPVDAVDVWEEICHPIMVATRKVPEVPYILQMRSSRLELDIFDFKEEVPKVLHCITFLFTLKDERLTKGKIKSALLKFYRKTATQVPPSPNVLFVQRFTVDLCAAVLVAKVLPAANITLGGVMKPVVEGRGSVDQIVQLGLKALGERSYAGVVRDCLAEREKVLKGLAVSTNGGKAVQDEDEEDEYGEADEEVRQETGEEETEAEQEEEGEEEEVSADEAEDSDENGQVEGEEGHAGEDDEADEDDEVAEADEEDEDDEVADEDDEEDEDDEVADALESFLVKFKTALHAIYEAEAQIESEDEEAMEKLEAVLDERIKAITVFKPLQATIPSMEEAQTIARRAEARGAARIHKPVLGVSAGSRPKPVAAGGGAGGGLSGADRAAMIIKSEGKAAKGEARPAARKVSSGSGTSALITTTNVKGGVEVEVADLVEPEQISLPEVSERAQEVAKLLGSIEPHDQQVWSLVLEPTAEVKNLRTLARTLSTPGTGAEKAYNNVKQIARCLPLKNLLHVPDHVVRRDRSFALEITGYINSVKSQGRKLDADSRQLAPLKAILDHAAAALVRLEALKTNYNFSVSYPDQYSRETVTLYYEEALRALTDLADPQLRGQARQKADADTDTMLKYFRAEKFVEKLVQTAREYMSGLQAEGCTKGLAELKAAFAGKALHFEDVEQATAEPVPAELLVSEGLGEVFDEAYRYVLTQAWAAMQPIHEPEKVAVRLKEMLREVLVGSMVFTPEMRRHQERPAFALQVVSLDKVTGNVNLKDFYVRVSDDGQIAYVEGFEEGEYVDLFELREYKPSRVHAAAKKKEEEEGVEELQTGRKYLFSVGRTKKLFGDSPSELLNGCIRAEGGGPKVFPIF